VSKFSWVRTLGPTLKVVPDNGGFLVIFLLKGLSVDWTFFRVKTQDRTMLVRADDDSYLLVGIILEKLVWGRGIVTTGGAIAATNL
jgi:hypothetical protein